MSSSNPPSILAEIVQHKQAELAELRPHASRLEQQARERTSPARSFKSALAKDGPSIISELKKASPSKGLLAANYNPVSIARSYEQGGASALSVLTDRRYFQGSLQDLVDARAACALPALRKDFTIDRLQVFEAAAHGADAILLIAAILDASELRQFRELAAELKMAALVEVHDEEELSKAVDSGADIIGVNNRNLKTFVVDLNTSIHLSELMPADVIRVSESGIANRGDIDRLAGAGFHAFLVGESLMKSSDPASSLQSLLGYALPANHA
jgi:indole-3-glycerol phosphate synthase